MKKTYIVILILVLMIFGLFYWSYSLDPAKKAIAVWAANNIECSSMEGEAEHFHPVLHITVDGQNEAVPAEIGITSRCLAEIHTHDDSGTIHIESPHAGKPFTLGQFFIVWEKTIDRPGYTLVATVDGNPLPDPANLLLADKQNIVLTYTKK